MGEKRISNQQIARVLAEIGEYLEMEGVPFKPRAYEKTAQAVGDLDKSVSEIYAAGGLKALEEIPGVGASIAKKIEELLKTGRLKYYDELKKKVPVDLSGLRKIEGLGPKSIKKLYEELGIKTVADLEKAAQTGKIARLEHFGAKSEENIKKGLGFLKKATGRALLGLVLPQARKIEARLGELKEVEKVIVAGSLRRWKETIGDLDVLVVSQKPKPIMDFFVAMPEVVRITAHGATKSAVKLESGLNVDLRVVPAESYGAALNYFTGSKDHNVALREIAMSKGYKLNEYGLFKGAKMVAGRTEEELYAALGMDYVEPEMRENTGEIELAKKHKLPKLISYDDLLGDLQIQTDWSDGADTIEAYAQAALERGHKYIAITDHTKRLAMTGGLDEKKIRKQWAEIDRVQKKIGARLKILKSTECDVLKDGALDLDDETLSQLDVVGVAVHSHFNLSRQEQTRRIIRAIKNPNVDILFHPTGRLIGKREPYDVDMDAIIKAALETGAVLEIDAFPDRLDLKDEYIRKCVAAGVKLSIDTDAHSIAHLDFLEYGIAQARRGWAQKSDVINTRPLGAFLKLLKK
ncbi:MAG: DNA polymerase/3'-5' exonuclease PolX [candidate division Zixibacteria bacterium]|nr:DNA polymerase/3'-5' exonuclease PolX [candidate division Zixibacteria bacterium]